MTDRLLEAEIMIYRRALASLNTSATGSRKTLRCDDVARITGNALDEANILSVRRRERDR